MAGPFANRVAAIALLVLWAVPGVAQPLPPGVNTYGYAGLIDMPSAAVLPDGQLTLTTALTRDTRRNTLTFQITPRLSGSFRYAQLFDRDGRTITLDTRGTFRFDRSLSLRYVLATETPTRPAVVVGLNDFLGTGIYRSEYVVASKTLGPRWRVTGGIGWGRLAGVGGFRNPLAVLNSGFETRGTRTNNQGGEVEISEIFQGPAAVFGGVEYQATDRLRFIAEYSSDRYRLEDRATFDYRSPVNLGVSYRLRDSLTLKAHYLYGDEVGVQISFALNPKTPARPSGLDRAPPLVVAANRAPPFAPELTERVATELQETGLEMQGLQIEGATARVTFENARYPATAQAIGRAARVLTGVLPAEVNTFILIPVENGLSGAQVTVRRADLEAQEFALDGAWASYASARIAPAEGVPEPIRGRYPRFEWDLRPYLSPSLFDPDDPLRADLGLALSARFDPAPGWRVEGAIRKKLVGNLDEANRPSTSVLPRVRSEFAIYEREGDPAIPYLTVGYQTRVSPTLYARAIAGYFEPQFGGAAAELLWRPVDSQLALGLELAYAKQRDFDQRLGFRDYDVVTGHASLYYDFRNGFSAQVDAGRYLAGDWGATVSVDRRFRNGWSVGAFATLTDVPFDDFGEGSFDKGIRLTVPLSWVSGQPTREQFSTVIRPVTRDGGARLNLRGRLHEVTSPLGQPHLRDTWGRFWR